MMAMDFARIPAGAEKRSVRLDRCEGNSLCNALGIDLPVRRLGRGARPRRLRLRWQQTERDLTEQGPLRAARWQVNADARNVLDNARADLDETLSNRRELSLGQWACLGYCRAHGPHQPECRSV